MALFYATGKISEIGEIVSGTSVSGNNWSKQEILLETENSYNSVSRILIKARGEEKINLLAKYKTGDAVKVAFAIHASEWKGRYYNDVDLVNIESADTTATAKVAPKASVKAAPAPVEEGKDDLPF